MFESTLADDLTRARYNLSFLKHLERYVAVVSGIAIPFNNYVTGTCAFTHKAGVHSKVPMYATGLSVTPLKAVTSNPEAYEILNPEHFGVQRNIQVLFQSPSDLQAHTTHRLQVV